MENQPEAFLYLRVDMEHFIFDPFVLDYRTSALNNYCQTKGYRPYYIIYGGIKPAEDFERETFPVIERVVLEKRSCAKILIVCHWHELAIGIRQAYIRHKLKELNINVITLFE